MSSFKRIGVNLRLCMSVSGTSRHFVAMRNLVVIGAWRTSTKPHQSSSIYRVRALAKHPKRRLCEIGWRHHGTKCLPRSRAAHDVRAGGKLLSTVNAICPSSPPSKNNSLSPSGKSVLPARPVLSLQEGRIAIVTNAGGDAVDAAASARKCVHRAVSREWIAARRTNGAGCVRQNRVVPTPVAGAKLSVVISTQPDRFSHQAGSDGDKTNSSPGRARHKP